MKASNAAVDQIVTIRTVVERYGMANIPPALQDFIRLRLQHPDASMKELGALCDPPLSKSAINHRVRRLEQMAREAKGA